MRDVLFEVPLRVPVFPPLIQFAVFEEIVCPVLAGRVDGIVSDAFLHVFEHGLLDIVEDIVWQCLEDLRELGLLKSVVELTPHVRRVIILLIVLKHTKLFTENFVPSLEGDIVSGEVSEQLLFEFFAASFERVNIIGEILRVLIHASHRLLIRATDLASFNIEVQRAVCVNDSTSEWLENSLSKRTLLVLVGKLNRLGAFSFRPGEVLLG